MGYRTNFTGKIRILLFRLNAIIYATGSRKVVSVIFTSGKIIIYHERVNKSINLNGKIVLIEILYNRTRS